MSNDEQLVRQVIEELVPAMRDRDAKRTVARYAPGIVTYTLAPPLVNSGPAVLDPAGLDSWFAGFDGPIDYEIRDLEVTVGGDVAYAHSVNRLSATPNGSAQGFELWLRATYCLRRADGEWKITHEHTSTPFYMDGSFRAAVDLKP